MEKIKLTLCYAVVADGHLWGWKILTDQKTLPSTISELSAHHLSIGPADVHVALGHGDWELWLSKWPWNPESPAMRPPRPKPRAVWTLVNGVRLGWDGMPGRVDL